jgi:hypothetical protein
MNDASPAPPAPAAANRDRKHVAFVADKFVDFLLIFVGLYAATALQRYQDTLKDRSEYLNLLRDFKGELSANLAQEASIAKDLGPIDQTVPGENLGPMAGTFTDFFATLEEDERVVHCLHVEFSADLPGVRAPKDRSFLDGCHGLYAKFDKGHAGSADVFKFRPAVLTPFYRYEVWELYLAGGVRIFRNKDLAVKIGEIYNNAHLIEREVADIEKTYNDTFMVQVGRSAGTDAELAEIVHDEEEVHGLSPENRQALVRVMHDVKEERYAAKEAKIILELKVERMKHTVLLMRQEIAEVTRAIEQEIAKIAG